MSYYNTPKSNFGAWMANFNTVCAANAVALGLDIGELAEISGATTQFANAFTAQETARAAAHGATSFCDQEWSEALAVAAKFNAQFQAIPNISPLLLGQLGLTVPSGGGGTIPVFEPTNLSAFGSSNGVNALKWNRNGNADGTTFVIEAAYGDSNTWTIVDTTTVSKYNHANQTPGAFVRYRVIAQRGSTKSAPSGTASVYDPGVTLTLVEGGLSEAA